MTTWQETFKHKYRTLDEVAATIQSGDTLFVGNTCAVPYGLLNAINARRESLHDVTIIYNFCVNMLEMLFDEETRKHFRLISIFASPIDRISGEMGILEFHSAPYEFFTREVMDVYKANTLALEVCPPDDEGYVNVGILSASLFKSIHDYPVQCKKKIAVINTGQFPAQGDEDSIKVRLDWFDLVTEDNHDLPIIPPTDPTEVDKAIAHHIMPYVNNGDTVQIGMGGLGEQITEELHTKKNITIYTEITVESMMPLVECGAVKKIITCGAFGTSMLYDFIATSPVVEFRDFNLMLDPMIIGQQDNMVAINSTFMVDLIGQACSESQGIKQYSGVGGSFGYLYGATRSKGGRSFLCLRSNYKDENGDRHSNVVAWLPEKSMVTTPKYLHMFIVSEYGVADVFLKTNKDRIRALLHIAHPDFRAELKEQIISTGQISEKDFDN